MGELLNEDKEYHPQILKKLAYNGVWEGKRDYYNYPLPRTVKNEDKIYSEGVHELESPCFSWEERICFAVDESTKTRLLHDNPLFKMAKKHISTTAWWQMQKVINSDIVYWYRPTYNWIFEADITVTSGKIKYLRDFKVYDSYDVYNKEEPFLNSEYAWTPDLDDAEKTIHIMLKTPRIISEIRVYEDCYYTNHISELKVILNNGAHVYSGECDISGKATKFKLDVGLHISQIDLKVISYTGRPGISEVELLPPEALCVEWPMNLYSDTTQNLLLPQKNIVKIRVILEKAILTLVYLFTSKIKYESRRFMKLVRGCIRS